MNPYLNEFRHFLGRRALIALVVVAALAGAIGYLAIDSAANSPSVSGAGFWYYSENAYHLEYWVFDPAGSPTTGVRVDLTVTQLPSPNSTQSAVIVFNETHSDDRQGRLLFDVATPTASPTVFYQALLSIVSAPTPSGSFSDGSSIQFPLTNQTAGAPVPISDPLNHVAVNFYSFSQRLLVVWGGPNGTSPVGDRVAGCDLAPDMYGVFPTNCSGSTSNWSLGSLSGFETFLSLPPDASGAANPSMNPVQVLEILNASGGVVYSSSSQSTCYGSCGPSASVSAGPGLLSSFASDAALILPLVALLLSYWSYARPRLSGTHEPVLVRPVTRGGLFLTRYGSVALALLSAAFAELMVFDLGLAEILQQPLPWSYLAPLIGGLLVAALGLAGLVFLSAHTFRTTGPVLGVGIALFLLFTLFWSVLVAGTQALFGAHLYGPALYQLTLRSQLLAPPLYPITVTGALTGITPYGGTSYAAAGVSGWTLGVAGAFWIGVPFLLTWWRAVSRD